jgi:hypothetical protein
MRSLSEWEAPRWVVVVAAIGGLLALVYAGSRAVTGRAADPAPPRRVYPGMYDIRAEAAKLRAAQPYGR